MRPASPISGVRVIVVITLMMFVWVVVPYLLTRPRYVSRTPIFHHNHSTPLVLVDEIKKPTELHGEDVDSDTGDIDVPRDDTVPHQSAEDDLTIPIDKQPDVPLQENTGVTPIQDMMDFIIYFWLPLPWFMGPGLENHFHEDACPYKCFATSDRSFSSRAKAIVYHLPGYPDSIDPNVLSVGFSMESDVYYGHQSSPIYMSQFDIMMTYHPQSTIPIYYVESTLAPEHYLRPPPPKTAGLISSFISNNTPRNNRNGYLMNIDTSRTDNRIRSPRLIASS
eukprot:TRINITY_DN11428_c0_g1_i1.p1 TRINITY_DN11428_c0_g1~~TRINITY_DN11428_c0_g1_i1.p1  ORF type:complete len:291 (-),score=26.92 TRINITY_DN11428_c0_g1_i1:79-915(-)